MKALILSLFALVALTATAHAGVWAGATANYIWYSDVDFNHYNVIPALAVGFDSGAFEVKLEKVADLRQTYVGDWFKRTPYHAEVALKYHF